MSDNVVMIEFLLIHCDDCGNYRRVYLSLDELKCAVCQTPIAFLRDPERVIDLKRKQEIREGVL